MRIDFLGYTPYEAHAKHIKSFSKNITVKGSQCPDYYPSLCEGKWSNEIFRVFYFLLKWTIDFNSTFLNFCKKNVRNLKEVDRGPRSWWMKLKNMITGGQLNMMNYLQVGRFYLHINILYLCFINSGLFKVNFQKLTIKKLCQEIEFLSYLRHFYYIVTTSTMKIKNKTWKSQQNKW